MTIIPKLLQHGEHLSALYEPLPGQPPRRTDDPQREAGQGGILQHYDKRRSASAHPQALGWIKATYQDAIEYTGKIQSLKGLAFAFACFLGPALAITGAYIATLPFKHSDEPFLGILFFVVVGLIGVAGIIFSLGLIVFSIRIDFFHLSDQPIIFDRKHRRVYRLFSEMPSSLLRGLFQRWPVYACAYDWDLIDAEHDMESVATGATITSNHSLMFAVRKSADDTTIIDSFRVGNSMSISNGLTDEMWEHIRRFMEADGPHLPSPNEPLAEQKAPLNWWQSLGAAGVFGPGYRQRWDDDAFTMLLMHLGAPVTVPMHLLWATGNWWSYKTEIEVDWPDEVKRAVGQRVKPSA